MTVHQRRTHPTYVPGCFGCKAASLSINPDPSPQNASERQLRKDLDAYARLRREGLQPRNIKGAADLERKAETAWEVEHGHLHTGLTESQIREAAEVSKAIGIPA